MLFKGEVEQCHNVTASVNVQNTPAEESEEMTTVAA